MKELLFHWYRWRLCRAMKVSKRDRYYTPKQREFAKAVQIFCSFVADHKANKSRLIYRRLRGHFYVCVWEEWKSISPALPFNKEERYLMDKLIWNYTQLEERYFLNWYKLSYSHLMQLYEENRLSHEQSEFRV